MSNCTSNLDAEICALEGSFQSPVHVYVIVSAGILEMGVASNSTIEVFIKVQFTQFCLLIKYVKTCDTEKSVTGALGLVLSEYKGCGR